MVSPLVCEDFEAASDRRQRNSGSVVEGKSPAFSRLSCTE